jgi:hypothetical protein
MRFTIQQCTILALAITGMMAAPLPTPAELVRGLTNTGASTGIEISHPALVAKGLGGLGAVVKDGVDWVKDHKGTVLVNGGMLALPALLPGGSSSSSSGSAPAA